MSSKYLMLYDSAWCDSCIQLCKNVTMYITSPHHLLHEWFNLYVVLSDIFFDGYELKDKIYRIMKWTEKVLAFRESSHKNFYMSIKTCYRSPFQAIVVTKE